MLAHSFGALHARLACAIPGTLTTFRGRSYRVRVVALQADRSTLHLLSGAVRGEPVMRIARGLPRESGTCLLSIRKEQLGQPIARTFGRVLSLTPSPDGADYLGTMEVEFLASLSPTILSELGVKA